MKCLKGRAGCIRTSSRQWTHRVIPLPPFLRHGQIFFPRGIWGACLCLRAAGPGSRVPVGVSVSFDDVQGPGSSRGGSLPKLPARWFARRAHVCHNTEVSNHGRIYLSSLLEDDRLTSQVSCRSQAALPGDGKVTLRIRGRCRCSPSKL